MEYSCLFLPYLLYVSFKAMVIYRWKDYFGGVNHSGYSIVAIQPLAFFLDHVFNLLNMGKVYFICPNWVVLK